VFEEKTMYLEDRLRDLGCSSDFFCAVSGMSQAEREIIGSSKEKSDSLAG
jgi:hypothetical protein